MNRKPNASACTLRLRDQRLVDAATNRLTSSDGCAMTYDAAGNQTYDCVGTHFYEAENRMTKAVQGSSNNYYFHDGNGKRVRRMLNGTQIWGSQETRFVYGFDGEPAGEYAYNQVMAPLATAPQKEYGYRGKKLLVVWDGDKSGNEQLKWLVQDHLGSTRMEADKSGSLGGMRRHDYAPFGEEMYAGIRRNGGNGQYGYEPPPSSVRQRFTGYERDNETGLDFAQARYFASLQGRFSSPDPLQESAKSENPQSWNRYSYVLNTPLVFIDPTGLEWMVSGDANNPYRWVDECPRGGTCYQSIAAVVRINNTNNVRVYGSNNAEDVRNYAANRHNMIDVRDLAGHHNAEFTVADGQRDPEEFLSPDAAKALFNAAARYHEDYPDDGDIVFTAGSYFNGQRNPIHTSHLNGNYIDIRYMDANGNAIQSETAFDRADRDRTISIAEHFNAQGFRAPITGDQQRFGFREVGEGTQRGHRNHMHLQRRWGRPQPRRQ